MAGNGRPLYILPFDHRDSFESGLFGLEGALSEQDTTRITAAKRLVYEAVLEAIARGVPRDRVAVLVDEQFGASILEDAHARGIATACPVEKSGQTEVELEYGEDFARHVEAMNPTYCKVLVRYNPDGSVFLNARQVARLRRLSDYLVRTRRAFLFELLVPAEPAQLERVGGNARAYDVDVRPSLVVRAIHDLQKAGVEPDVWKVEGLDRREDCVAVAEAARRDGRTGVTCVVLGRHADDARVLHWLEVAASVPGFVGFAIGRSTFWNPLKDFLGGSTTEREAIDRIARSFRRWVDAWERARGAGSATSANEPEVIPDDVALVAPLGLPSATRACLFDLDGVITRTASVHAEAWKQMFDDYLRARSLSRGEPFEPFDSVRDYERFVDGKPRADGTRTFLASRGITLPEGAADDPPTAETVRGLGNRKNEILLSLLQQHHAETYEGSVRYVRAARARGLRTAVVSSSKNCAAVLASAGIADLFDARIDGLVAEAKHLPGKPAPDTYLAASRALGVAPAEAVVFEDALAGVEAGRAGHFGLVVGVDRLGQSAELRRHGADVVVNDLASLLTG